MRRSRACVINVPTVDTIRAVVGIGNTSTAEVDKLVGLTPVAGVQVKAP